MIGVRRCKKEDLRRIAAATGGTLLPNLADLEGGETFDAAHLGRAEEVSEEKVGDGAWRSGCMAVCGMCGACVGCVGVCGVCVGFMGLYVNVNELRLGFSNTTRNPEGILSHNNRKS